MGMGIGRPKKTASNREIKLCSEACFTVADFLRNLTQLADLLGAALAETTRFRDCNRQGAPSLDFNNLIDDIGHKDKKLANILACLEVDVFKMGKLSGRADGLSWFFLNGWKERLEAILADKYKTPFKVSVKHKIA